MFLLFEYVTNIRSDLETTVRNERVGYPGVLITCGLVLHVSTESRDFSLLCGIISCGCERRVCSRGGGEGIVRVEGVTVGEERLEHGPRKYAAQPTTAGWRSWGGRWTWITTARARSALASSPAPGTRASAVPVFAATQIVGTHRIVRLLPASLRDHHRHFLQQYNNDAGEHHNVDGADQFPHLSELIDPASYLAFLFNLSMHQRRINSPATSPAS